MKAKHFGRKFLSLLLTLMMLLSMATQSFSADTASAVAKDDSGNVYTSVSAAWAAAKKGKVITMQKDWNLSDRLVLGKGESATINMNGLRIDRQLSDYESDGEVIYLDEGATLTLTAPTKKNETDTVHTFTGWYNGNRTTCTVTNGGLVTGGWSSNGAGGIHMKASAKLTLDNVAVAGNCAEITWGQDGYGGGIMMDGSKCTLVMKNGAQIAYNEAQDEGGGVYVNAKNCVIEMTEKSSINNNRARDGGGGVYFCYGCFSISSDDQSGIISNNKARSGNGGAIFTEQCIATDNLGQISGITMENNEASGNGGAIYLNQEKTTVSRCTIKSNKAKNGAGIYVNNDNNTIANCTIENNTASSEGGGVFTAASADIGLSGTIYIRNNTRTNGTKDDLFLNDSAQTSYISSSPSGNSKIGVRTTKTDRDLNDDDSRTFFYEQAFFSDFDGYHIEYDGTKGLLRYVKGDADPDPTFTKVEAGTTKDAGTYNGKTVTEGYFRYAALMNTEEDISSNYYYSDGYFLDGKDSKAGDPTVYDEHLATLSMALVLAGCCSNIGLNDDITDQAKYNLDYTYKSQNIETVLTDIGIDPDDIYISDTYTTKPGSDTMSVAIGQKSLDGSDYTLVPIVVRSVGYESEWASNFTLGSDGEAAGFASAANQITKYVKNYVETYDLKDKVADGKVKFWVMGYSRGGGTANLTAKRLVETYSYTSDSNKTTAKATGNQVYAYCLAAPQGGRNSEMKLSKDCYNCIHNCINKVDPVPEVAPDEMGFMRYGVDHYVPGDTSGSIKEDTYVWSLVQNESWANSYKTWYDNESWTVGSSKYNSQREKMLKQLNSVDPVNLSFTDYFSIAEQDVFPTSTDALESSSGQITQEEYIHVLMRAIESFGLYHGYSGDFRDGYHSSFANGDNVKYPSFESAIQTLVPIYYNMTSAQRSGMMQSISYGAEDMLSSYNLVFNGLSLYDDVVGDWCTMSQSSRDSYLKKFWNYMMCTKHPITEKSALDYMTADQQNAVKGIWDVLMDVVLRFVAGDYSNDITDWGSAKTPVGEKTVNLAENYADNYKNYGDHSLVVLGTLLYNTEAISQGHYPEINYAWLRSYDSFYDNDGDKPITVTTDKTPKVEVEVNDNVMTLTTDVKGAAMFYRLSNDGTTYGSWMPYNLEVSLSEDAKYVQTTAIYCGNYSSVETIDLVLATKYLVTVNGTAVGRYAKDATVTVDGTATGDQVFKSWNAIDGVVTGDSLNNAVLTFKMPGSDVNLTSNYATRAASVKLTVNAPEAGKDLPATGTLTWTAGGKTYTKENISVYWLEQIGDGDTKTTQLASGKAKYGTKYSVAALVEQDVSSDLVFSTDISKEKATVVYGTAESQAYQAETDAAGALRIYGDQISTAKAKIKTVPEITVAVAQNSSEDTAKAKLPTSATVTLEDDTQATVKLDLSKVNLSSVLSAGGDVSLPIIGTDSINEKDEAGNVKAVTVHVTISKIAAPTASAEGDQSSKTVTLKAESGTTIKYKINGGEEKTYTDKITLNGEKGKKLTYVLTAWAEKDNGRSSDAVFTYVFDQPYTVTVKMEDTAKALSGWTGKTGTYKYYSGDKVTIAAPAEQDEIFDQWKSIPKGVDGKVTDTALSVSSISGDIEVTAVYNPVVNKLDITMDEPQAAQKLTGNIDDASFKITKTYKLSELLAAAKKDMSDMVELSWVPSDKTAGYATAYTAKLTLSDSIKFFFADNLSIGVNNNSAVKASTAVENGKNIVYITFPATDKAALRSVEKPSAVTVSEADAKAGNWNLQKTATITFSDGSTDQRTIAWTALAYDANQLSYKAAGTVDLTGVNNPDNVSGAVEATIVVIREEVTAPEAPIADLPSGSYEGTQYVRLSCSDADASIYYTIDGNDPATNGILYQENSSITISADATLKAIAVKDNAKSEVSTYDYKISAVTPTPSDDDKDDDKDDDASKSESKPKPNQSPDDRYKKCAKDDTCPIAKFSDSDPKAWYHDGVHYCLDQDLMKGISTTEFAPNANMTRAQLVTILWRMDGEKNADYILTFDDVTSDSWYNDAVCWAASNGVVNGYSDEKFGPDDVVTREQLATILWRYAQYKSIDVSVGEDTNIMDYDDLNQVSSYAISAVQWALGDGIINGMGDGTLQPLGTATRAQTAAIFQRFCGLAK